MLSILVYLRVSSLDKSYDADPTLRRSQQKIVHCVRVLIAGSLAMVVNVETSAYFSTALLLWDDLINRATFLRRVQSMHT